MVQRWSGRETRALRNALRLTVRAFADQIGVSHRMISKWEKAGEQTHPRPANQAALDTLFATAPPEAKERFLASLQERSVPASTDMILPSTDLRRALQHPGDGRWMAYVDEGVYLSGQQDKPVWLGDYWIDLYPVTNQEYAAFIKSTGHRTPKHWTDGRYAPELAHHPVVFVDWNDAASYADWAGKKLPSALQWEKAARGTAGNTYPWGMQPTIAKGNFRESANGTTTPVDGYQSGASPYGVYDLCGNTWEWTATSTTEGRYQLKGSAFTSPFERCTPSRWNDASSTMLDDDSGFRCATTQPPRN